MNTLLRPALVLFTLLSALTGVAYPLLVTGIGRAAFPEQAAGSLVLRDGRPVGSVLIGQAFSEPGYFWGRPSATSPMPYNATASGGSNLGPLNPALADAVKARIQALRAADPGNTAPVPVDLVTASGSGLDPEISLAAARYQAGRVARARQLPLQQVNQLIDSQARRPWLGFLGEPRVNVLALNLALKETQGRSQVFLTPSGGLTQSGRSGGALKETQGRSQVSLTPLGGLTRSGRSGGSIDKQGS